MTHTRFHDLSYRVIDFLLQALHNAPRRKVPPARKVALVAAASEPSKVAARRECGVHGQVEVSADTALLLLGIRVEYKSVIPLSDTARNRLKGLF